MPRGRWRGRASSRSRIAQGSRALPPVHDPCRQQTDVFAPRAPPGVASKPQSVWLVEDDPRPEEDVLLPLTLARSKPAQQPQRVPDRLGLGLRGEPEYG